MAFLRANVYGQLEGLIKGVKAHSDISWKRSLKTNNSHGTFILDVDTESVMRLLVLKKSEINYVEQQSADYLPKQFLSFQRAVFVL